MDELPKIVQGGMGIAISNWRLARTVSRLGQLGVVSGTALDQVLARRLEDGDPRGHMRRAFDAFPFRGMAERVWNTYFIPCGKAPETPYTRLPTHAKECPRPLAEIGIIANFVEVYLAREGHDNPVGINYLEKIQTPHLVAIYGAMLAGVGVVLMGAGIPLKIPGVLDAYVDHEPASYPLYVVGAQDGDDTTMHFTPRGLVGGVAARRPSRFLCGLLPVDFFPVPSTKTAIISPVPERGAISAQRAAPSDSGGYANARPADERKALLCFLSSRTAGSDRVTFVYVPGGSTLGAFAAFLRDYDALFRRLGQHPHALPLHIAVVLLQELANERRQIHPCFGHRCITSVSSSPARENSRNDARWPLPLSSSAAYRISTTSWDSNLVRHPPGVPHSLALSEWWSARFRAAALSIALSISLSIALSIRRHIAGFTL